MDDKNVPLSLKETQSIALEVLDELDSFCREHNICYYLICGALIGAVRSGDLIPWDDDIDVAMKREDYDRFCKEYSDNEDFTLFTYERVDDYRHGMVKLARNGTLFIEPTVRDKPYGVFVDIFPLDWVDFSDDRLIQKVLLRKRIYNYAHVISEEATKGSILKTVIRSVLSHTVGLGSYKSSLTSLERLMASGSGDHLINYWGAYGKRECMPAEYFDGTALVNIRGEQYPAPIKYHEWLTQVYGDYMTPPQDPPHYHGHAYLLSSQSGV